MKNKYLSFTITLLTALISTASLFAQPASPQDVSKPAVRFAVIGDRTGGHVPGIYEEIVAEIERMRPDFVLTVGDMIEGYTSDTVILNKEWKEYKTIISPLTMPIYFTPGNHDITTDGQLGTFEREIGKPYYSIDIAGMHFVFLDNSRWESSAELPKEQLDWLASDLKKNANASCTFVFHHKPFWYATTAQGKPDTLHSLFRAYGVDAVFTGHFHEYFSGNYDGIEYTSVGSSGGGTDPGPTGLYYHFTWVTVDHKGINIAPIRQGSVLPWDEFTASDEHLVSTIRMKSINFTNPLFLNPDLSIENGKASATIRNLSPDIAMVDTIRWELPAGWSVDPREYPVKINPKDSLKADFSFMFTGNLYPVPTMVAHPPFARNNRLELKKLAGITREAICAKADQEPEIDGIINESAWSKPNTILFDPDGAPAISDSTRFYFIHDSNYIYLAAYCKESKMDSISAKLTGQDAPVYGEDCVGYFLQPDINKPVVYQIYFSPLGTIFDQKIAPGDDGYMAGDPKWNGKYEVKTSRGANYWSVEARIPLSQLDAKIKPGQDWGLNFRRKQQHLSTSANWQVPIDYDPSSFGRLVIE